MTDSNFCFFQILYIKIGIFESVRIEQLEIRIYEKRPHTRSNVAMATIFFLKESPLVHLKKMKNSKLPILEIGTFDSKQTICSILYVLTESVTW